MRTSTLLAVHAHGHRGRLVALGARAARRHHAAAARLAEAEVAAGHHDVRDGLVHAHDAQRRRLRRLRLFRGRRRRYERDEVSPQASIILRLADLYGISTDTLLRGAADTSDTPRQVVEMQVGQGQTLSITINATVTPSTIDEQK